MSKKDLEESLNNRALSGLAFFMIPLAVFIFLPAWTFKYPQAWAYLFTFGISVLLITIDLIKRDPKLLERRLSAGAVAEKEKSQKIIQALANIFFCGLYIIAGLDYHFQWSKIPIALSLIADIFVALGFYIVYLVFKVNSYTSGIIEVANDQGVISTGPYKIIRHPMYAGAILMLIFSAIALGSYWAELSVAFLIIAIVFRLIDEEKYLAKNLKGYKEYCQRVHYRLLPYVW